jgi:hypothetical protein
MLILLLFANASRCGQEPCVSPKELYRSYQPYLHSGLKSVVVADIYNEVDAFAPNEINASTENVPDAGILSQEHGTATSSPVSTAELKHECKVVGIDCVLTSANHSFISQTA